MDEEEEAITKKGLIKSILLGIVLGFLIWRLVIWGVRL
jgi:hypothetical protein